MPASILNDHSKASQKTLKTLHWASMHEVIGEKRMGNPLEKIKYGIRFFLSKNSRQNFLSSVSQTDLGRQLFESTPTNFYIPLRSYLDSRFTVKERFDVCLKDVETALIKFGETHARELIVGKSLMLLEIGQFKVDLQMNRVSRHEGFWAITVKDSTDQAVSNLSFGFLDSQSILIASIQGIKDPQRDMLDLNKRLTKEAFGLRPQNLLLAILQTLCATWQIENLIGIDPRYQVKRKLRTEKQGFKFNYETFWTEQGAQRNFTGYWVLSNQAPLKNLNDVPSHKRNQYRKRNTLIQQVEFCTRALFTSR